MGRSKDVACSYKAVAVTPSDSTKLPGNPRALYVGSTGNITALMADGGTEVLFSNVPVGVFPIQVQRVNSTGTTAANIVALY